MLTGRTEAQDDGREADTRIDPAQLDGGESFVGRTAADDNETDDPGYIGETGAERRSEAR